MCTKKKQKCVCVFPALQPPTVKWRLCSALGRWPGVANKPTAHLRDAFVGLNSGNHRRSLNVCASVQVGRCWYAARMVVSKCMVVHGGAW